jgi:hypothetical protein
MEEAPGFAGELDARPGIEPEALGIFIEALLS